MNFVFISPHFPKHYWNFCDRLHKNGVNVLGIGDCPYDELRAELKASLTEYYFVQDLSNYNEMYRAVAFFAFKYGKIDWIESNNEFWLEQDARLRTDFHVTTGYQFDEVGHIKNKSAMKEFYAKAGVPTARLHKITDIAAARKFIDLVDYPVIVKPDVGVGACDTFKLENDGDLQDFFAKNLPVPYVMEEFITGDICSYDAIIDADSKPLLESMTVWPPSVMDIVLKQLDLSYYTTAHAPVELKGVGRATVKAFDVRSRFVHLEFFRLTKAKAGLGEVGDFVGLEVNMRPAGGYTPDMINFAHSTDVYQVWADMITDNIRKIPDSGQHCYCVYASRRDCHNYVHTHGEIMDRYGRDMVMCERMPEMMVPQMGNQMYTAKVASQKAVDEFIHYVLDQAPEADAYPVETDFCFAY
ncbi:putative ATP binding protein [Selenomonas ruminantium subsp. lactilytica TAM6421]|uniref:Putative ATP binding protein n=1 Tax=Selenomonas ruminantium subsp. lactilytica (strain NBRC 103574 / TAM6421) TaxID=927704 RepID=I0GUM1_SELRL|nr:putative ATP binding protein [Selenomonas ruminantium]BAL84458.1 putative ATP binding protein [Selenomonas ruminantium subsp. lactilytica TAM6421]